MAEHEHPFGHEPSAIATRRVLATGGVLALTVIGVVIVLHFALRDVVMPYHAQVAIRPAPIPPPPRLQASPGEDLARFRATGRQSGYIRQQPPTRTGLGGPNPQLADRDDL